MNLDTESKLSALKPTIVLESSIVKKNPVPHVNGTKLNKICMGMT